MGYFIKLHSTKEENEIWLRPNLILAIAQVKYKDLNNKAYSGTEVTYETGAKDTAKAFVKETPTEILEIMRKALADYCEELTKIGIAPQGQIDFNKCSRYNPANTIPWLTTPSL